MTNEDERQTGREASALPGETRGTLGTVRNAVLLLNLLSEGPAYRQLRELADEADLSAPTVHRLLRSLVLADLAEQEPGSSRYGLGPEVVRLAQRYLARLPCLGALAPYLVTLRDELDATIQVAILVRGTTAYVDRVDAVRADPFREPARAVGAFDTASGRLLVARANDDAWATALAASTKEAAKEAEERRAEWREATYLIHGREVAVPVFDGSGSVAAALSATGATPPDRQTTDTMVPLLSRAAEAAGRTLGHG